MKNRAIAGRDAEDSLEVEDRGLIRQRIRRRDGATRWGVYYDSESPGLYLETFVVGSWAEHERQHDRFTVADREIEIQVSRFTIGPPKIRHFIYARKARLAASE